MFEYPRRGRQARNFTTNAPKILDLKSSSELIFSRKLPLGAPEGSNYRESNVDCSVWISDIINVLAKSVDRCCIVSEQIQLSIRYWFSKIINKYWENLEAPQTWPVYDFFRGFPLWCSSSDSDALNKRRTVISQDCRQAFVQYRYP